MLRRTLSLMMLAAVAAALAAALLPAAPVRAACTTLAGSFATSPITTPTFAAAAGETIVVVVSNLGDQVSAELRVGPGFSVVSQINNALNGLTLTYTAPAAGSYNVFISHNAPVTGDTTWTVRVGECATFPGDNRINPHPDAPVAIYCQGEDIAIWAVNEASFGVLALYIDADTIADVDETPTANTLIASDASGEIRLYRLSSGELQVNAPNVRGQDYVYLWETCAPNTGRRYIVGQE